MEKEYDITTLYFIKRPTSNENNIKEIGKKLKTNKNFDHGKQNRINDINETSRIEKIKGNIFKHKK